PRPLLFPYTTPFRSAAFIHFHRIWDNRFKEIRRDNQGNDLRPPQTERPAWREKAVSDLEGYYEDPFLFYLTAGEHTITLVSQRRSEEHTSELQSREN